MKERKPIKRSSDQTKRVQIRVASQHGVASPVRFWFGLAAVVPAVTMVIVAWYYCQGDSNLYSVFVSASRVISKEFFEVSCSRDYDDEQFSVCKPKFCGRVVMDALVSEEEAEQLLRIAKLGLTLGGSNGGASILDLHSGALSKGDKFVNIYSVLDDDSAFTKDDFTVYRNVKNKIKKAITEHFQIPETKLYLTKPTFFSRFNMSEPKTIHDEYWHPHVDKETYGSFHYTSLLYLTTYGKDFDGGRFIFIDKDVNRTVEPRAGRVSFFTSGSENVHFVERLKDGVRYAITISFTCDPSKAIPEPAFKK